MSNDEYVRKSFTVIAKEVTFENIHEVAAWCRGTVETVAAKLMGTETQLPAIKLKGQGENRNKVFTATLGCYIVELKGSFRVYKQAQFFSAFEEKPKAIRADQGNKKVDLAMEEIGAVKEEDAEPLMCVNAVIRDTSLVVEEQNIPGNYNAII